LHDYQGCPVAESCNGASFQPYQAIAADMTGFSPVEPESFWAGALLEGKKLWEKLKNLYRYSLSCGTGGSADLQESTHRQQKSPTISIS